MGPLIHMVLALCAVSVMAEASCYWPNGDAATSDYAACPTTKQCCVKGEACLSNGLCFRPKDATLYRGACSDASWPIADCTNVCFSELNDKWANLWRCDNDKKYIFSCGELGAPTTCKANLSTYEWKESDFTNVTVAQLDLTPTEGPTMTVTASAASTSSDNSKALGIGLGVGLGVPMIIAAASLLWFYIKTRRQIQDLHARLEDEQRRVTPSGAKLQVMRELDTGESVSSELQSNPRSELPT